MSIITGVLSRNEDSAITDSICQLLRKTISRNPNEKIIEYRDKNVFLAKVDCGAYGPGFKIGVNGSVTLLAGEPLLDGGDALECRMRADDLEVLQKQWDNENWDICAQTRGSFCAVHYEPKNIRIYLITDRLGVRPLYYWHNKSFVIIASALRILEEIPEIYKELDIRGTAENACFGFSLSNRTPYTNIFMLRDSEIVQIDKDDVLNRQYWRWDRLRPLKMNVSDLLSEAYIRFSKSVKIRLRNDRNTVSFLSGGLDSRCIVGVLRSLGTTVRTYNFGMDRTRDKLYAAQFAKRIGAIHVHSLMDLSIEPNWAMLLSEMLGKSSFKNAETPERIGLAWSGDGGSVGLGHVYMSQKIICLMREGKIDDAIYDYLHGQGINIPKKLFKAAYSNKLADIPRIGVREELADLHCEDPGRQFHLFLMLNDQRRHLCNHYETIDLHRMELHLPFFDCHFLELILASPIDLFVGHQFYNEWLSKFSSALTEVPWQSYPGHMKCPLSIKDDGITNQWSGKMNRSIYKARKRKLIRKTYEILKSEHFPKIIMRRIPLYIAIWVTKIGSRNYDYILKYALNFYKCWKRCKGKYNISSL